MIEVLRRLRRLWRRLRQIDPAITPWRLALSVPISWGFCLLLLLLDRDQALDVLVFPALWTAFVMGLFGLAGCSWIIWKLDMLTREESMPKDEYLYKIRITSPDEESAELLRQAFKAVFGDALTLGKARKGSNPKYADSGQVLAYGELELLRADLEDAIAAGQQRRAPATGETINLSQPKKRRT